jgi:phosphotriesterase-related protein
MATVLTVLGPIDAGELGPTLVHEHVLASYPGDVLDPTGSWDRSACIETGVRRMTELRDVGVRTLVDASPIEFSRDPGLLAEISERSGMNVVCATGFYLEHIGIPYYWRIRTQDEITELFLHEIEHGIDGSSVKPGVIKIASGDPPTDLERRVIAAAAVAARESGLTIISHCENSAGWDVQLDVLGENGADPSRCLIGHQDQAASADQLVSITERGAFVGVDRVGYEVLAPDDQRVQLVKGVIDAGHADRLCLSMDHMCCLRSPRFPYFVPEGLRESFEQTMRPAVEEQMFRRPYTYLFTDFLPQLEAAGVERARIDSILTDNPRALFGG